MSIGWPVDLPCAPVTNLSASKVQSRLKHAILVVIDMSIDDGMERREGLDQITAGTRVCMAISMISYPYATSGKFGPWVAFSFPKKLFIITAIGMPVYFTNGYMYKYMNRMGLLI